jgi:hypothetical protein
MSKPKYPLPAKLIMSIIFSSEDLILGVLKDICDQFGQIDFISEWFSFSHTKYYEKEMGPNLKRKFISFDKLISMDCLPWVKERTNELELRYSDISGKRKVNIDPGILTVQNLVLSTGKPASHRIYLGKGIYGDLTLIYRSKTFTSLEWTYPDYASREIIELFNGMRLRYLYKLREEI